MNKKSLNNETSTSFGGVRGSKDMIVEVKNLVKKFPVGSGFFTALNGVNLQFSEGDLPDW